MKAQPYMVLRVMLSRRPAKAAALRQRRQGANLTQEQLANLLGMTPAHYARVERGDSPLQLQTWLAVLYLTEKVKCMAEDAFLVAEGLRVLLRGSKVDVQ